MAKPYVYLGELLVKKGVITSQQLQDALEEQKKTGQPLGATLIHMGFVSEEQAILPSLAEKFNISFISLKTTTISQTALARLPAKAVNHYKVFPVKYENGVLTVAMGNPWEIAVLDDLAMVAQARIQAVLAGERDIIEAIREHYGLGAETIERMMS